jgi:hypothetical protein
MDKAWLDVWTVALILSGAAFFAITLVVAVRGGAELLRLLRGGTHGMRKSKR